MKIIYLHGFNSSGRAKKARLLAKAVKDLSGGYIEFISPDLSYEPDKVIRLINSLANKSEEVVFVGSSLGGLYASYFANQYTRSKAVLINPVVNSSGDKLLKNYYGQHKNNYTGEVVTISDRFVSELQKYMVTTLHRPERSLLLLQTDDEVLDYQLAVDKFPDSPQIIRTGGGHVFTDFEQVIPEIINFIV